MKKEKQGFTLIEVVIATGIVVTVVLGTLSFYRHMILLSRYNQGYALALQEAQAKLEEMRAHPYSRLTIDYGTGGAPGDTFPVTGLNGRGVITFDTTDPAALGVRIVVSWEEKGGILGEDLDLDGNLDVGEDRNGNGLLDAPVELVTYFTEEGP